MIDLSKVYELRNLLNNKVIEKLEDELGNIIYESWRKLLLNGIPPLTLLKCKEEKLVNYKIYGNSVQEGTPSIENPIEVQSVGDKTLNLFDITKINSSQIIINKEENYFDVTGYSVSAEITPSKFLEITGLKIGDTFTASVKMKVIKGTGMVNNPLVFLTKSSAKNINVMPSSKSVNTITIPEDFTNDNYYGLYTYGVRTADANNERCLRYSNFMILKGEYTEETLPEYEPYNKYKIPVKARGKNLVDVNVLTDINNCVVSSSGDIVEHFFENIINGKTYTLYFKYEKDIPSTGSIAVYNGGVAIGNFKNKEGVVTFTANNTKIRCYIPAVNGGITTFKEFPEYLTIMIEEGDTLTKYEPYKEITTNIYLDEPLRKVGDFADYIDFKEQKIFRCVEVTDNTGTSTIEESLRGLDTPISTSIELPEILLNSETNIIEIDTTIAPSNMEVEYYGRNN